MSKHYWTPTTHEDVRACAEHFEKGFTLCRDRICFGSDTLLGAWADENALPIVVNVRDTHEAWFEPTTRTKIHIMQLKEAEEKFIPLYVRLYEMLASNPLVLDTDLALMGFPPRKPTTRGHAIVADQAPAYRLEPLTSDRVRLHFHDSEGRRRAGKPRGQHGVEIAWLLLDEYAPVHHADLTHADFATRTPHTFDLGDTSSGKYLYLALRWENRRGEKGPWTPVHHVIIP
jgi:hypothetical protein